MEVSAFSAPLVVLCVFLGPIEHTQFSDLLSVPNQSNENADDAENAEDTQRGESLTNRTLLTKATAAT
jgi:hypothetical protein